jgi:DNA mismatch repair protein MutS
VLLDEVGRGTSTFDGLSIAWAVTEYLHDKRGGGPKTMFATHYHELVDIARVKARVRNYNIAVRDWEGRVVFLRKIVPGGCSRSYGIQVAKLAGIPVSVIERAREILSGLERNELDLRGLPVIAGRPEGSTEAGGAFQPELFGDSSRDIVKDLEQIDLNDTTPLQALNILADWKKRFL